LEPLARHVGHAKVVLEGYLQRCWAAVFHGATGWRRGAKKGPLHSRPRFIGQIIVFLLPPALH
jgi:hypothetical protein